MEDKNLHDSQLTETPELPPLTYCGVPCPVRSWRMIGPDGLDVSGQGDTVRMPGEPGLYIIRAVAWQG